MTAGKTAQGVFNMKSARSFLGLAALLLAIIALVLTGCPSDGGGGDNPGNSPDTNGGGGDPDSTVTSVTVSPPTVSVAKGETQPFTATVNGTNSPAQTVTWSVSGGSSATISADGVLSVAANETAVTLTVKASSTVDAAKSGTATVTLIDGDLVQPSTDGILTVTGLSAYNGKYIWVMGIGLSGEWAGSSPLLGVAGANMAGEQITSITLTPIIGGQAAIKIYEIYNNLKGYINLKGYSGSDTVGIMARISTVKIWVPFVDSEGRVSGFNFQGVFAAGDTEVSFQNGKATATFEFHAPQPVNDDDARRGD
jgi:hypothetical protein